MIKSLPPNGFERLCQRVLRESGFQSVIVTGRTGDGGIDGIGVLQVNPFVSFNVLFQCKRYQGSVTPSQVRDFRGAMAGRADKGIMMTTGTFTVKLRRKPGAMEQHQSSWSRARTWSSCSKILNWAWFREKHSR